MIKPRLFTGIQATGILTLGNYCGLIHHILKIQEQYEVVIMIADLHASTIPNFSFNYQKSSREMAALLYACGLNENCKVFIQSKIKEHLELFYLLSPHVTVGRLSDMIQFNNKKKKGETGSLSLLAYPVLMAADIFLYIEQENFDLVIVGQDQEQHLELTNKLANAFNKFCNQKILKVPTFKIHDLGGKIMGLKDPTRKMSKSGDDYIGLFDKPQIVEEKIKKALTDSEKKIYYDSEKRPGISNLLTIYSLLKDQTIKKSEEELKSIDHYQFKLKLIDLLNEKFAFIQKRYHIFIEKIDEILEKNNQYLQKLATKKISAVKKELKL
jgi:tryptophanyl-tRNA synthetase